nr:GPW/gp25 family protein [uncultured Desulfobacter sp.]
MADTSFLGRGWAFPPEFSGTDRAVKMVSQEEDIKESLWILLSTSPGERVMRPTYGCGLNKMVFETIDETAVTQISDMIERAVLFFEHRITLDRVTVSTEDSRAGFVLQIHLEYTIRTTNSRGNIVYPFYLNEGTNVRF